MAQSEPGEVLTILDERPATGFYWRPSLPVEDIIKPFGEREAPPAPEHALQHD